MLGVFKAGVMGAAGGGVADSATVALFPLDDNNSASYADAVGSYTITEVQLSGSDSLADVASSLTGYSYAASANSGVDMQVRDYTFNPSTDDRTFEVFLYYDDASNHSEIAIALRDASSYAYEFQNWGGSTGAGSVRCHSAGYNLQGTASNKYSLQTWEHWAIQSSGGTLYALFNGEVYASFAAPNKTMIFSVGARAHSPTTSPSKLLRNALRISNEARYPTSGSYTVPSTPFPAV